MSGPATPPPPPPLPPEPFVRAVRNYRNRRTFNFLMSLAFLLIPCASVTIADLTHHSTKSDHLPVPVFYIGAGLLLLAIVNLLAKCIRNVREPVEVTPEGIRAKDNFWYWPQVSSITPKKVSFADQYFFRVDLRVSPKVCLLMMDPAPSYVQCAEIIARLGPFLAANHPNITIQDIPR